jgi:hypothetical protein
VNAVTLDLARRHGMRVVEADARELDAAAARQAGDLPGSAEAADLRAAAGYRGPGRP